MVIKEDVYNEKRFLTLDTKDEDKDKKIKTTSEGVPIIWKDLTVIAHLKRTHLFRKSDITVHRIIKKVSGAISPGNFVAILGASGSGKSTLMSVLASRNPGGLIVEGEIRVAGRLTSSKLMKRISGYVFQDDIFMPCLTVMEHLTFVANLKLDRRISSQTKKESIIRILTDLGLRKCINTIIMEPQHGKSKANLSGGELRRLSVAVELLTDPPLLFCDEPTTGLDSFSALELVSVLKKVAVEKNKTIICSIHQPSEQIFQAFHQIILMNSGRIAFIGAQDEAVSYLERFDLHCPEDINRAEFLVKSLSVKNQAKADLICEEFPVTSYAKKNSELLKNNDYTSIYEELRESNEKLKRPFWIVRLYILTYRLFLQNIRDKSTELARVCTSVALAVLIGVCVRGTLDFFTQNGVQALKGTLFVCTTKNFFPYVQSVANNLPKQMPVFYREYGNETSTPLIFLLSNLLSQLPGLILSPAIFFAVFYVISGLETSTEIAICSGIILILLANTSAAFGTMFSILFDTHAMTTTVSVPIETTFLAISGVYLSLKNVPSALTWIEYISWFKYSVEALFSVQFRHVNYIACSSNPKLPCIRNGNELLSNMGFNSKNLDWDIICIIIIYVIMYVVTFITLSVKMKLRSS